MVQTKNGKFRENVRAKFRRLTPEEWGKICSIPLSYASRGVVAVLFANYGEAVIGKALSHQYGRLAQVNNEFRKARLPYRLRSYALKLPEGKNYHDDYWETREVCVCTIMGNA